MMTIDEMRARKEELHIGIRIVDIDNEKVMVYNFKKDVLPTQYSFEDVIPIGLSDGECGIDFSRTSAKLNEAGRLFPHDDI